MTGTGESGEGGVYLSVVVPVYDEAESLDPLYGELVDVLARVEGRSEIVLVDDGSRDESLRIAKALEAKDARVRVIALDVNAGQSAALGAGFRAARGEVIATLDADLQNDPADIVRLLPLLEGADVVNGIRTPRFDSWSRRLASRVANAVRNRATGVPVSDIGCSLRVMRAHHVRRIKLYNGLHRFLPTLLAMEGARLREVEVSHRPRRYGTSKYGIGNRLFVSIADLLAVCWMQRRALRYGRRV
ncbi:MAG: glycosyltransferase family 2 protein [Myxococcota bacterium]|nr:glycosyltransferase family 2 protein [Myxococcota bacterium]